MNPIFLEFILSHNCNQNCCYCVYPKQDKSHMKAFTINLSLLKNCLDVFKRFKIPMFVEFSGGEPGLATNLDDAINLVYSYKNLIKFQLLSNGLVRLKRDIPRRPGFFYNEHLIYDADDNKLIKFYDIDYIKYQRNVIILTDNILKYLLERPEQIKYFSSFSEFKIINPKIDSIKIENQLSELQYFIKMYHSFIYQKKPEVLFESVKNPSKFDEIRVQCSNDFESSAIDLEHEEIVQCSTMIRKSNKKPISERNLLKLYYKKLFNSSSLEPFCNNCYFFHQLNYLEGESFV